MVVCVMRILRSDNLRSYLAGIVFSFMLGLDCHDSGLTTRAIALLVRPLSPHVTVIVVRQQATVSLTGLLTLLGPLLIYVLH